MYVDPDTKTKMEYAFFNLFQPNSTYALTPNAKLYIGGDRLPQYDTSFKSCLCEILNFRFIRDLFFNDTSLMDSFSGYSNRIDFHGFPPLTLISESLFVFNLIPAYPESQYIQINEIFTNTSDPQTGQATRGILDLFCSVT